MYRFLLGRRWLGLLAAAIMFAVGCGLLGDWQLHRLASRHARNDLIRANLDAPARDAGRALAVGSEPDAGRQWEPVRARGRWDPGHELLVRLRPFEGQVGYYVLTPLVTGRGPAVLVNRGWVPTPEDGSSTPAVPAPPSGLVTIIGRLRQSEPPATGTAPPAGQVTRIDVPRIARTLPYDLYGGFLELTRQQPAQQQPAQQQPAQQQPRPGTHLQLIPPPEPSEGPHLLYAVQWFLFGCMSLGGYVVLARREAAERHGAAPRPVPTAAAR